MDSLASQGMTVCGGMYGGRSFAWRLKGDRRGGMGCQTQGAHFLQASAPPQSGFRKGESRVRFPPPGCLRPPTLPRPAVPLRPCRPPAFLHKKIIDRGRGVL